MRRRFPPRLTLEAPRFVVEVKPHRRTSMNSPLALDVGAGLTRRKWVRLNPALTLESVVLFAQSRNPLWIA